VDLALAHETMARWQFGFTTVYHYLFVPLTISLAALTAGLQTAWVRTDKEKYFLATKFWGKLFLINIAMGVATGLVQEFQFGMNWSAYSKFVGDVFGAPLAMEALLAFFFESTFIGLWIFGWDRLPRKVHLGCIWMVSIGTVLSTYFILAANSFMQHPAGYRIGANGRAQLTSISTVLFQDTTLSAVFHTLSACFIVGGAFLVGVSAHLVLKARRQPLEARDGTKIATIRTSLRLGLWTTLAGGIGALLSGDTIGRVMVQQQPMKMAAAEGLWHTAAPAPFSLFAIGSLHEGRNVFEFNIPGLLSFLSYHDFHDPVRGIVDVATQEAAKFGGGWQHYVPDIFESFWAYRGMITFGMASVLIAVAGLWLTRQKRWIDPRFRRGESELPLLMLTKDRELTPFLTTWAWRIALLTLAFPLVGNALGWLFTEMGRQPWVVYGLMTTADAVSSNVPVADQVISLCVFVLLYGALAVVEVRLLMKYIRKGIGDERPPSHDPLPRGPLSPESDDEPLTFAY
jgi:cytochrome d ubiquinol oxidase subunit I